MPLTIRRATTKDRVLQYGTVACSLLKDIGNASNQPYLQAIASISLLIMETVQRVEGNKDACVKMTERAYELVCAIINICRDSEAELAPAMVRSITQFSETLEKILSFVRSQIKGGFWRRMFRSMEDADLITECNAGLKHALDVFGVQSGIIAAMTMAEMQKDATQRHEELITILKEKRSRPKRSSTSSDGSSSSSRKKRSSKTDVTRSLSMLPASPKIFYGREEEVKHLVNTIMRADPITGAARIAICGAEGVGKTAVALAAAHSPEVSQLFGQQRYFVECDGATDAKQLVCAIALALGLESTGKKPVIRQLTALGGGGETKTVEGEEKKEGEGEEKEKEKKPVLLVLDALDRAWKPHENRSAVEDFLSLLADLQHVTLIVTVRGGERPRQVRWTRPFLPTLSPLAPPSARLAFLDISDVPPTDPALDAVLAITAGNPSTITHMAGLASFEGCAALVARWEAEGPALLQDKAERAAPPRPILLEGVITEEPEEMSPEECERVPGAVAEKDVLALLESCVAPTQRPMPSIDSLFSDLGRMGTDTGTGTGTLALLESCVAPTQRPMPSIDSLFSNFDLRRGGTGTGTT
ncbi:hypothetical protein C8R44DRAFT_745484 [Mycena epipterygia]|nr:hypothetical protein C8R44DRAFT_745484 [Mycena epipterygia]